MPKAIGIYRETKLAGKPELDQRILDLTAQELKKKGFEVSVKKPEDFRKEDEAELIFTMARGEAINNLLMEKEREGVFVINRPEAIRFSFNRKEVYKKFINLDADLPRTDFFGINDISFSDIGRKVMLKPANRHEFFFVVEKEEEFNKVIEEYKKNGFEEMIVQDFVNGEHTKYYAIGDEILLPKTVDVFTKEVADRIKNQALLSGKATGLKIFGGDFMVLGNKAFCVDTNDWPSFSVNENLTQEIASVKIADLIEKEYNNSKNK